MSRALRYAGAALLTMAVVVTVRLASANPPAAPRQRQTPQVKAITCEEDMLVCEANKRLEEIKVELALLADIATFPYYLGTHASDKSLRLRGFVPNELVRQRALELARQSTVLRVDDALQIQTNLAVRPPLRAPHELQRLAVDLLHQTLGEPANHMSITVQSNGVIVITGSIDSLEGKLEVSRLFRRLSGCGAAINQLTVSPRTRNGERVVQVTRDGSLVAPPSALGLQLNPFLSSVPTAPLPAPIAPAKPVQTVIAQASVSSPPSPLPRTLEAHKEELRLPTAVPPRPAPERIGMVPHTVEEPKLPVKWTSSAPNWEAQAKKLEPINVPSAPAPLPTAVQPAKSSLSDVPACRPAQTVWTRGVSTKSFQPRKPENSTRLVSAEKRVTPPDMTWQPPHAAEESEPKTAPLPQPKASPVHEAAESPSALTSPVPPISRPRRWPPAYESKPPENNGRPGVITFDDEAPPSKPTTPPAGLSPAKLQHQVKSICGRQARDVTIQALPDGHLLVHVKVANRTIEENLSPKILAVPEMTSPQVRLLMDVGP